MTRILSAVCALALGSTLSMSAWALAEEAATITIVAPQNGTTVSPTFDIKYEIVNGPHGGHAHVYLDGAYQKGFKGTFSRVPKGSHTITVKIADHDHKDAGTASDSVTITVTE
ncbi:MAG: hypothetical protein NBKEAIPA_02504 [Nitrospirae bacterium]|nr:MAG: hypothetical protein UZ03_NOB001002869 [Nitrospira sp. OLB3]MBV6470588.1 hypothetical protein [Nitrospirota bacterium]MCE7965405.1 hypothetical protein [Nitrospira sp. NTP2]MCK6493032.1 DUF4399 domain-containing protein [Nitrospira sp.]MEB2338379.1 hypothetical protein [Nitrospirales bacterium]